MFWKIECELPVTFSGTAKKKKVENRKFFKL